MEDPLCRAKCGTRGWMKFTHHQAAVMVEAEAPFCAVSTAEACCSQGEALAPDTVQLDRVVDRMYFGLQCKDTLGDVSGFTA